MADFTLHPQLVRDTVPVHRQQALWLLLMNDSRFPWLLLVPCINGVREWHDLPLEVRSSLFDASLRLGEQMQALFRAEKLNVAMIGNRVQQFHLHHVARFSTDAVWPDPVWGRGAAVPYDQASLDARLSELRTQLDFCQTS